FSADGMLLVSAGGERHGGAETVRLWGGGDGRPVALLRNGQRGPGGGVALSPDGSRLAGAAGYQGGAGWGAASLPPAPGQEGDGSAEAQSPQDRAAAEWVLKREGIVQVRVEGAHVDVNSLDVLPQEPFRLTGVDLGGKPITDAGLENLKGLAELRRL